MTTRTQTTLRTLLLSLTTLLVLTSSAAYGARKRKRSTRRITYTYVVKGKANINKASVKKLRWLPGIGLKKARSIVAFRRKRSFATVQELKKIKGIGPKLFARIKRYVTVSGETTITRKRIRRNTKRK